MHLAKLPSSRPCPRTLERRGLGASERKSNWLHKACKAWPKLCKALQQATGRASPFARDELSDRHTACVT
jgi:hypothetical protein